MGYSPRYHAASLAAVFLALAIGILIGSEFGGDVVSSTRKSLEKSLLGNLSDARGRNEELATELGRSNEFSQAVYPVLVRNKLAGRRIGVLALGNLPGDVSSAIEDALGPTGARLVAVGVVREPPDLAGLAGGLSETRFFDLETNPDSVEALGTGLGRQIVLGGTLLDRVRGTLFSRASGRFGNVDGVIVVRDEPDELGSADRTATGRLETGLVDGLAATRTTAVGVESSEADPSSISFFGSHGTSSVDDVDLVAGRVAMVYALLGAEGSFGVKDSSDRLLPDLLTPAPLVPAAGVGELPPGNAKARERRSERRRARGGAGG
jgi:copper transport outer membrane protein MctB